MKKAAILFCMFLIAGVGVMAQVGINTDGTTPHSSAMLDVKSSNRGLLPPRMTHAEFLAIASPANGLIVYCTDCGTDGNGAFYGYFNGVWNKILTCFPPAMPVSGTHVASENQIVWNWNAVEGASGYRWNTANSYSTALDLGNLLTKTETGLTCNTAYTRYVWAYNDCDISAPVSLTQTTTQNPPVGITIAASANPVCSGTSVTFTATPTNGGTSPAYQWRKNGTAISGATNATYTYTPLNNDAITCQLTSSTPCSQNNPALSNTITMTVNQNLPVSVSITASANPVCTGTSVTFTATAINGGATPLYQWRKNGTNITGATNATYTYSPANGDSLRCQVTSNALCPLNNPAWSNMITMTVNVVPVAPSAGTQVAAQTQITWNWNTVPGATGYKWNTTNDYSTATDMGTATTKTETGLTCNTAYTRYVWAYNGCGNSASTQLSQSTTTVGSVGVTISVSSNGVCAGTSVNFTATPVNGGTAPVYQWKVNGANMGANSPTYSYTPVNNDDVSCILTSNASCVTGNPATSDTITMSVFQNTPVGLTITASSNPVCAGVSATFTAIPVNGGQGPLTQWYVNGTAQLGEWNPTFTYIPANGDIVTCNMYAAVVCPSVYPVWSNAITMTVNTAPVSPSEGVHIPATNQIEWHWNTVPGATGYKWNTTNDTTTAINMGTQITKTETSLNCSTAYTRYVWAYNTCGKSIPVTLNQTTLTYPPAPVAGTHVPQQTQITWNWNTVAGATGYKWNTTDNYATATNMGTATTKTETGLTCNTAYTRYVWTYNTCGNSTAVALNQTTSACGAASCAGTPTVSYGDQTYNTVQIGSQCWLKQNLNIGTMISGSSEQTNNGVIEKYCYDNNPANCAVYGGLYQWNEMMQYVTTAGVQGICPSGWHIPTDAEWTTATTFLGGTSVAGGKMKTTGTIQAGTGLWNSPNTAATNESGFSAVPAGYRYTGGSFYYLGYNGYWWSSTEISTGSAWNRDMGNSAGNVDRVDKDKGNGFSVRCLRD